MLNYYAKYYFRFDVLDNTLQLLFYTKCLMYIIHAPIVIMNCNTLPISSFQKKGDVMICLFTLSSLFICIVL